MKVLIRATAHYSNGHNGHFSKNAEVSNEEYELIRLCAEADNGCLDSLENQSEDLYRKLHSLFEYSAKSRGASLGSYVPLNLGNGVTYRRRHVYLRNITMYLK